MDTWHYFFADVSKRAVIYPCSYTWNAHISCYIDSLLPAGEQIGAFGLTEPDHGSDPGRTNMALVLLHVYLGM